MPEAEEVDSPQSPPAYLEVVCKSSGKKSRFAAGTKAGFAVLLINRKLGIGAPVALHIESVKEGEEPISFGPDAVLVDYGNGWKLQTVTEMDFLGTSKGERVKNYDVSHSTKRASKPTISSLYIAKVLLAFVLMFVLAAIFMLALDNLPRLILFINSSL